MKRALGIMLIAGLLVACGGDGHEPDRAGFAAWANAEYRQAGDPVDPDAVDTLFDDFDCSHDSLELFLAVADEDASNGELVGNRATIYFGCGEDVARDHLPADVADEMIETFASYDGG